MFYLSLLRKFFSISFRSQIEYPMTYVLGIIAQLLSYGFQYVNVWIMVQAFGTLGAWNSMEILFLYSLNMLSYAIGATFTFNTSQQLMDIVRTGKFDDVLLKPMDSLIYMISSNINVGYLSHLMFGIFGMTFSLRELHISLEFADVLWLLCVVVGSALIHASFLIITSVPSLFILNNTGWGIFYSGFWDFINYPLSIFGRPIQILLTCVLPYGFIAFYPALHFLKIHDSLIFPPILQYLTPLIGFLLFLIAFVLWHIGANHYESSGS